MNRVFSPAILENNFDSFKNQIEIYSQYFETIDIDLVENMDFIAKIPEILEKFPKNKFNLDVMLLEPQRVLIFNKLVNINNIYIRQKHFPLKFKVNSNALPVVSADENLLTLSFYNQFSEVQFMSVVEGAQGSVFLTSVLEKIGKLAKSGFKGQISIDGGINAETIVSTLLYPISKYSIGSFFSKNLTLVQKQKETLESLLLN